MSVMRPPMFAGPIDRQEISFNHCDSSLILTGTGFFFSSTGFELSASSVGVTAGSVAVDRRAFMSSASWMRVFSISSSRLFVFSACNCFLFFFFGFYFPSLSVVFSFTASSSARLVPIAAGRMWATNIRVQTTTNNRLQLSLERDTERPPKGKDDGDLSILTVAKGSVNSIPG